MIKKTYTIVDPNGLSASPASHLVAEAGKYESHIEISHLGRVGDLKSILNVLSMMIKNGEEFEISADGTDEVAAVEGIENCLHANKLI